MKRIRTHIDKTNKGKLFCSFIALIAASQISEKLRIFNGARGHGRLSKDKLSSVLDKVKHILRDTDRRLVNPVTKQQREIFTSFGISETELESYLSSENI
jgi:hypothetical protein